MRDVLSSLFFILIFIGLGAMAFAAANRGEEVAQQGATPAAESAVKEADEPQVTTADKYNFVAIPLDVSSDFSSFDVNGLVEYVGAGVTQVLEFDAECQGYRTWTPSALDPMFSNGFTFDEQCNKVSTSTPWPLKSPAGGSYFLLLSSSADSTLTFVGDVPAQGAVNFTLAGAAAGCDYNSVSLPLDQSAITNADELATELGYGNVSQVLSYDATCQGFETWTPSPLDPTSSSGLVFNESCQKVSTTTASDIPTQIGYPYLVCLQSGLDGTVWPAP